MALDFVVVVLPLHFWQSGEVGGSLLWGVFDHLWIIYRSRLLWGWSFLWVLVFVWRVCNISGHIFLFICCYSEVRLALGGFQVASVAGSFWSCFLTYKSDLQPKSTLPFSLRLPTAQGEWGSNCFAPWQDHGGNPCFWAADEEGGNWQ